MENKNTIIAIILMLIVWFGFSLLFPQQKKVSTVPVSSDSQTASAPAVMSPQSAPVTEPTPAPTLVGDERQIIVDHPLFKAVFTNIGARLKSFELKNYRVSPKPDSDPVNLVHVGPSVNSTLVTTGTAGLDIPADAFFNVVGNRDTVYVEKGQEARLVFSTTLASGLVVDKVYVFNGDKYQFSLDVAVKNSTVAAKHGSVVLALLAAQPEGEKASSSDFIGATTLAGGEVEKLSVDKMEKAETAYTQQLVWTAFGDKYFLSAIIPQSESAGKFRIDKAGAVIRNSVESPDRTLQPGDVATFNYLFYFGPRELDLLKQVGHDLSEAVDFGFFSLIARPLLYVLKYFYQFLGNYGLSIILLTIIIKLIFWPLTQKSYSSMKAMQKLQPEMQKIREKFAKDKEKLNREIMELYKTHRVNPLGGCLPMLVQIPVFFALYKVLMEAIEVRHAPFYLWIPDLAAKDPYYVTPLIMGATMFIQQKMTPTAMDPIQAKLFMLMPIIFTFMFLNFPSGLVIYWLVNNLLTIGQQYLINRRA
jgi:YidC/Oxa1 family membrane protein insertase